MGLSIYKRKNKVMSEMRKQVKELELSYFQIMPIIGNAIDLYIAGDSEIRRCNGNKNRKNGSFYECSKPISSRNKTGLCRTCYARLYRKRDQEKRLENLRKYKPNEKKGRANTMSQM